MKKASILLLSTFYFLLSTTSAMAVISNPVIPGYTSVLDPKTYFNSVLSAVISIFFIVGVVYFIWHIVFAGYHLISSEGDPKRWQSGKDEIIYAVVGLFAILSVFAIIRLIGTIFGITSLSTGLTIPWPTL
jgi:hypothetical protein